jgi:hypothetical protein
MRQNTSDVSVSKLVLSLKYIFKTKSSCKYSWKCFQKLLDEKILDVQKKYVPLSAIQKTSELESIWLSTKFICSLLFQQNGI